MKHFISVNDVQQIPALVAEALQYKAAPLKDALLGTGKKIGLLFLNPSLRTRVSTQVAAKNLGLETIVFNIDKEGWALEFEEGAVMNGSTVEHIKDAAPVLGSYFDIICVRSFPALQSREDDYAETIIHSFIQYAGVPVVSLESATLHPLQSLTDVVTITESMMGNPVFAGGKKPKVVLCWAPHVKALPQCVANSFAQWINAWGQANFTIAHPQGYQLDEKYSRGADIVHNLKDAITDADFIYVKNWSSYQQYGAMPPVEENWMLNNELLSHTQNAKVMHCLPVRRNVELSDEILDGPHSLVTTQASNRVWAAQAVLAQILKST